jgi:hypothetical protein
MADPLAREISMTLWPYLESEGFRKVTSRKFARERNGVFQQLWVDAAGVSGKKSTYVILCASLPFGPVNGYMDPHGFRIGRGRSWSMATPEAAATSMRQVVEALRSTELPRLNAISSIENLLSLLKDAPGRDWYATYSQVHEQWLAKHPEAMAVEHSNREALGL